MKLEKISIVIGLFLMLFLASCEDDLSENQENDTITYEQQEEELFKNHKVPKFVFTNQFGKEVSHRDYEGHYYITDFFFSTCPSICPIMTSQMSRLQALLEKEGMLGDVMLLSHTVDPENDTPEALKAYGEGVNANFEYWNFVTGSQEELYDQARNGYFMTALESDTAAGGFFHSDNFVLIDREFKIKGIYDGTSTASVDELFEQLKKYIRDERKTEE